MVTQYLAILGGGAGAGSDPMAETLPHGSSPAPAFPRSAEPGRLICGWPPPSTLSPTAKEFTRVSVTSDSFRKMLCAVETDSKDGPLCYCATGSLVCSLSEASLPGSVVQCLGLHGMMGKPLCFPVRLVSFISPCSTP